MIKSSNLDIVQKKAKDEKEDPIILQLEDEVWNDITYQWQALLNIKQYDIQLKSGSRTIKRILYQNPRDVAIKYQVLSEMPNIIEVITPNIYLEPFKKDYMKLSFKAPSTYCKIYVKIAMMNEEKKKKISLEEGIVFKIVVND
ncbi:hypothetical protein pb186bvf_003194 [Paramecium bursaria]